MSVMESATRTRIKVCGITRLEDALEASHLGVDALGFVFYKRSPRYIDPQKAAAILRQLPPFVSAVGLFVNPSQDEVDTVLSSCPVGVIQLHGDETPEFCQAQSRRVLKAVAVSSAEDLKRASRYNCPILLDAKAPPGVYGGTGTRFDWSLLRDYRHDYPISLAGGLNAENVQDALAVRQWFALDVSSGVEVSPGIKDAGKMRTFIAAVNGCSK
ncbi:phosphoribosylanthranilate isomerase [Mariprofundus ferrooxydans]|uniref:N-(5'-phosphoribosyl)anthranilate isomerase n=1 Tax=Mariprofundus ferrooxydans PV-1 TaxID=314345 RepID=Q0EXD7_9PROT|nr:phosphoribosylanthranilate isomerase [Mariprofundus ferrooxydans]EAU53979.1 N-(5'-phosphoribosyl)anthranilate isomerase [Mariprofundus ferrooxydans PV-1]KON47073.1 N-(5'-phosphoribosyl)anthranilate isomerase [Mariprofundus ferrooxydans]